MNLALNAVPAMEHSPIRRLLIRTSSSEPDLIQLVLEDTGPSVDDAHVEQLFESFFTTKASGMGIGLGVCRSIIEAHGGMITVTNRVDGGAHAVIVLPVGKPPTLDDEPAVRALKVG